MEDYSIVENELKQQLSDLKRDLHMKKVKTLGRKIHEIRKITLQRKLIQVMTRQVEELEPTVSKIYSPQNAMTDNQIKGYLVYLLQLKDFYSREVKTKKEIIQQREDQIKKLALKLCMMRNEYSKKKRSVRSKPSEFTQLENMSNKIHQLEQRLSSLKNEIKEQRENIMDMRLFQNQYKKLENKFRSQITRMTKDVQDHLDRAVLTYEEREEFVRKAKIYKERCAQDLRKAALNENALQLVLDKSEKLEDFGSLQNQTRYDSRIAATGDLIDQGITGLEPDLERNRILYSTIAQYSGKDSPALMEDQFKLTDDKAESVFSYLEQLLKEIHHTQDTIDELKKDSRTLHKSLTEKERKLKWKIEEEQKKAEERLLEATSCDDTLHAAEFQLQGLLERVQSLYERCFLRGETKDAGEQGSDAAAERDAAEKREGRINDSNAIDFNDAIEKEVLELLMVIEYLRVEELSEEDVSTTSIIGEQEDEELHEIDKTPKVAYLDTIQPRVLKSITDADTNLDRENVLLDLDELKERAVMRVEEIESEKSSESED